MSGLTWRQEEQFRDTCDIIVIPANFNSDGRGKPAEDSYQVLKRNVRYEHAPTPNVNLATPVGRFIKPLIYTTDTATFADGQGPPDGAFIRNTTLRTDGSKGPVWGKIFRILGVGRPFPDAGIRETNEVIYELKLLEQSPEDVPA